MDDIKVGDIGHVYDRYSLYHLEKGTILQVGEYQILIRLDKRDVSIGKKCFVKSELYNNTKPMTTTAKVIQERIVKKYLTNKKLDELTEIIEEVRDGIKDNKDTIEFCKKELETLEDLDYCLNMAIDEGNIDDIKTMENKYKEFLNGN